MQDIALATLQTLVLFTMLVGLFGLLTTIIPGLAIIWVAALVYGLITGFTWLSGILFGIMTVFLIIGSVIDNIITGASALSTGASWWAIIVATIAGVAGTAAFPPFGGLIAALLALFLLEWIRVRDWRAAFASTKSWAAGCGWAVLVRFIMGVIMILLWVLWVF
jgi:uncharacterized protein YqgC (DUF456 family)